MAAHDTLPRSVACCLLVVAFLTAAAWAADRQPGRSLSPATVVMQLPEERGAMERPAVEFDHAKHSAALQDQGCEACHPADEVGDLIFGLAGTVDIGDGDRLMDAYHAACTGCHRDRAAASASSGPVTCGECHLRRPEGESLRLPMAFDYSLHARHAAAYPDKCETCHHQFDEAQQKLVYVKGEEEGCRSCHGEVDIGDNPSLAKASHSDCVNCHLARATDQLDGGPVLCVGCHDAAARGAIEQLEEIPRLVRGQPDSTWIAASQARSKVVAFDHRAHEPRTSSCSDCHHQSLAPCGECHTLEGTEKGAGVTMADAYHSSSSQHSCVGCHHGRTDHQDCSGCHRTLARPPAERACTVCHSGPRSSGDDPELEPPVLSTVVLAELPSFSGDFPETVVIDGLADVYEPSRLPHAKIVSKLDGAVRASRLAGRFHGVTDTLCAGCHHHSPVGSRPPPCRSCHGAVAEATTDKPGLKVAYHRQCLGCHIEMGIQQQGCTDCHAARGETAS